MCATAVTDDTALSLTNGTPAAARQRLSCTLAAAVLRSPPLRRD